MRRIFWVLLFVLPLLLPKQAFGQTFSMVLKPPANTDFGLTAGVSLFPVQIDRVYLGGTILLGGIRDDSDPVRFGDSHWHLTWLYGPAAAVRIAGSFGVVGGFAWGRVRKEAHTHIQNYRSVFVGFTLGLD